MGSSLRLIMKNTLTVYGGEEPRSVEVSSPTAISDALKQEIREGKFPKYVAFATEEYLTPVEAAEKEIYIDRSRPFRGDSLSGKYATSAGISLVDLLSDEEFPEDLPEILKIISQEGMGSIALFEGQYHVDEQGDVDAYSNFFVGEAEFAAILEGIGVTNKAQLRLGL
jgi:hypothetical protein